MKFIDINKRYSEIVAEYMNKGYTINTASMSGTQGEVAKIDLTNGVEIIRIKIDTFFSWDDVYQYEGYEIVVGKSTDNVKPNSNDTFNTIWSSHLEVIHSERFYEIGTKRKNDFYGTKEEAAKASAIRYERYNNRENAENKCVDSEKAMEIAERIVRNKMGFKRINKADVKITKSRRGYVVSYRSKTYALR